ncbi:hypothetical protein [Novosphingobium huizhouense]|uniref:hypothetical protein n=1 Tax=Novosphingobium huizhouense TaxID=2866625 RepID=UPI001CD86016|nr:hypothetical protein [Novosphingobium huizhouense]
MKALVGRGLVVLVAGLAWPMPASAAARLAHSEVIEHGSGPVPTNWTGTPLVTARQVGAPGAAGRPASLRCLWRVDLAILRRAQLASGALLTATSREDHVFELARPGWCGSAMAAFAGRKGERDNALRARLRLHAAHDTKAVMAQADAIGAADATG